MTLRPALFLDRDGVINLDHGYIGTWDRFDFVVGIDRVIAAANAAGRAVVVVTNQSGVARGLFTEEDVDTLHRKMCTALAEIGAKIDRIEVCPHLSGAPLPRYDRTCAGRKPAPGMILRASAALGLDPTASDLIGDKPSDIAAAQAAGVRGHLYAGGDLVSFVAQAIPALPL